MEHRILREMNYLIHAGAWSFFEWVSTKIKTNGQDRNHVGLSELLWLGHARPLSGATPRSFNNYANRALDTLMYINGWASR
jgi:hypothetical protein